MTVNDVQELKQTVNALQELLIPRPASTKRTDENCHANVVAHYGGNGQCTILSKLFPHIKHHGRVVAGKKVAHNIWIGVDCNCSALREHSFRQNL